MANAFWFMGPTVHKTEVIDFASEVLKALGLDTWKVEWTESCETKCVTEDKVILLERTHNLHYDWRAKEIILHQIAHIVSPDDHMHREGFYKAYISLLEKYMVDIPLKSLAKLFRSET